MTPDSVKGVQTRERLLDAAAHVLTQKGFAGTRLADIAKQADLQAPAIYYYYDSREDLIEEVVRRGQQTAQRHVETALSQMSLDASWMEKIARAVEEHLRVVLDLSDYTTAAIRNVGQLPERMQKRLRADHSQYGDLWHHLFTKAQESGEIRADVDVTAIRLLTIGALNWTAEWWSPRLMDIEQLVGTALTLVTAGLAPEHA